MAVVLVTGSSTGIGLATAVTLARAGHSVFATMRDITKAGDLQAIASKEKLPVTITSLDVDNDESASGTIDKILSEQGRIDVLVNNAGVAAFSSLEEGSLASFRPIMATNYFGALRCIKAVLPGMRERRHGAIINVSSISGRVASAPLAGYSASKWALEALSECLAQEVRAFNVRVAVICPGVIATPT